MAFYAFEFVDDTRVVELKDTFKLCPEGLTALPYSLSDRVFSHLDEKDDNFVFVYVYFRDFDISFPIFDFESGLLIVLSVVLRQLHPNSCGFVKSFKIVCTQLDLTRTLGMFILFYQMSHVSKVDWVSLDGAQSDSLFDIFT
ncbi:hypothetical protein DEO72_LG2g4086 [Vigna unguiculata]|uniref:Uncharacterized protein n=1 Tax=Vigna unguiculata TaxID=3917 RepID=A0A4D6L5H2_VIGUN|nr:hypothetical protein DEO72_LG2g4086 [Vigna unguiculata]